MEFEKNRLEWLEFDLLSEHPSLFAGTFLRHGGTSIGNYVSLNTSNNIGDHPDSVKVNREMIRQTIEIPRLSFLNQVHGNEVVEITHDNFQKVFEADAFFTKEKGIALNITHADCQAAVFYDKENDIIAAVHAGWRGLVKNIYKSLVEYLVQNENTKPENLIACISPSLGPQHAEFKNYKEEFPKEYWDYQKDKHFDLWAIAKAQLREVGLQDENIEITEVCTYSNPKDYFSYRRDKITGRHATVIANKA